MTTYGTRKGVLGSSSRGQIKGATGPKNSKEVTLPQVKKAQVDHWHSGDKTAPV